MNTVKLGDITLIQGDCLEVMKDMPDKSVDVVITDPPYGIDYQSAWRTDKAQWKPKIKNDTKPFLGWGKEAYRTMKDASCIYMFYRWDVQDEFKRHLESSGFDVKSQIIWDKVIHGMGDLKSEYAPQHESIMFAIKNGFVFPSRRPRTIIKQRRVLPNELVHPNEKPVALICKLIRDSTLEGDTILAPFMGSGTTLVACARLGRKGIGIELDPGYFDIAVKRVQDEQRQMKLF